MSLVQSAIAPGIYYWSRESELHGNPVDWSAGKPHATDALPRRTVTSPEECHLHKGTASCLKAPRPAITGPEEPSLSETERDWPRRAVNGSEEPSMVYRNCQWRRGTQMPGLNATLRTDWRLLE